MNVVYHCDIELIWPEMEFIVYGIYMKNSELLKSQIKWLILLFLVSIEIGFKFQI